MYVHIFGYLVNKLEIWWVYLSPIEKKKKKKKKDSIVTAQFDLHSFRSFYKFRQNKS